MGYAHRFQLPNSLKNYVDESFWFALFFGYTVTWIAENLHRLTIKSVTSFILFCAIRVCLLYLPVSFLCSSGPGAGTSSEYPARKRCWGGRLHSGGRKRLNPRRQTFSRQQDLCRYAHDAGKRGLITCFLSN